MPEPALAGVGTRLPAEWAGERGGGKTGAAWNGRLEKAVWIRDIHHEFSQGPAVGTEAFAASITISYRSTEKPLPAKHQRMPRSIRFRVFAVVWLEENERVSLLHVERFNFEKHRPHDVPIFFHSSRPLRYLPSPPFSLLLSMSLP